MEDNSTESKAGEQEPLQYNGMPLDLRAELIVMQALAKRPIYVSLAVYPDGHITFLQSGALDLAAHPHDDDIALPEDFMLGVRRRLTKMQEKDKGFRPSYTG